LKKLFFYFQPKKLQKPVKYKHITTIQSSKKSGENNPTSRYSLFYTCAELSKGFEEYLNFRYVLGSPILTGVCIYTRYLVAEWQPESI